MITEKNKIKIDFYNKAFNKLTVIQGPPNIFFLENALKKAKKIFSQIPFLYESTILLVNNGK